MLTTPVQFWCGYGFYRGAIKAWKRQAATMDTLVALGVSAAYGYSFLATILPDFWLDRDLVPAVYYETAVVVITLILLGTVARTSGKRTNFRGDRQIDWFAGKRCQSDSKWARN